MVHYEVNLMVKKIKLEQKPSNNFISVEDQFTLLKVKSLLNQLSYFLKEKDLEVYNKYHEYCRKTCVLLPETVIKRGMK